MYALCKARLYLVPDWLYEMKYLSKHTQYDMSKIQYSISHIKSTWKKKRLQFRHLHAIRKDDSNLVTCLTVLYIRFKFKDSWKHSWRKSIKWIAGGYRAVFCYVLLPMTTKKLHTKQINCIINKCTSDDHSLLVILLRNIQFFLFIFFKLEGLRVTYI